VVGVCLGAQLLARAAGALVGPATEPEVGWLEIELTADGLSDPVLGGLRPRTESFQWHHYTFEIPAGATELARSRLCPQAFRLGDAWGLQFHAEATLAMIDAWLEEDPDDVPDPDGLRKETEARIDAWNERGRALAAAFLEIASSR
jgi:GMP synthase (glutamine-hydrolysing)